MFMADVDCFTSSGCRWQVPVPALSRKPSKSRDCRVLENIRPDWKEEGVLMARRLHELEQKYNCRAWALARGDPCHRLGSMHVKVQSDSVAPACPISPSLPAIPIGGLLRSSEVQFATLSLTALAFLILPLTTLYSGKNLTSQSSSFPTQPPPCRLSSWRSEVLL